jgi:hypothetical protein
MEGWVDFLLKILVDHASLVIPRIISVTEDTPNITRSFFMLALDCGMITSTFDATWFKVAIVSVCPYL